MEAGGWEVIKKYVALGMGISIVTSICLSGEEDLVAIPFNRYFPKRTYGLVQRKGKLASTQAVRFIEMLTAQAKASGEPRREKAFRGQRTTPLANKAAD